MSVINREAGKRLAPKRSIRFINNRVYLEEPEIRAAAVGTLGKYGQKYIDLRPNIQNLLL